MIEKALIVIIFMYSVSFAVLAGQYLIGDVFGITLKNYNGDEIRTPLLDVIDQDTLNSVTLSIANANDTRDDTLSALENAYQVGISVGFDLVMLLTGTYIFNLLWLLGVPPIIIAGMVIIYAILLGRALIAYIRGV